MLGLMFLLFFCLYALLSLGVVLLARAAAKRARGRPWLWGWLAALVMYHLVFWDWIPTAVLYPYYQSREAGVWVYETPEQWLAENPAYRVLPPPKDIRETFGVREYVSRNPNRLITTFRGGFSTDDRLELRWPHIRRSEVILLAPDGKTEIARVVYFLSGECTPQYPKVWIERCWDGTRAFKDTGVFYDAVEEFIKIGVEEK